MKNDKEKLEKPDALLTANPWLRFGGWMVDFLLWAAVWLGLVWLVVSAGEVTGLLDSALWVVVGLGILGTLGNLVVTAGFTHWFGGSIGKLVFGMEVMDEQGKRLSFWRAVWREWFGSWVSGMALWLGFAWIFIDEDRRGWHDMMAGSRVIVKRKNLLLVGLLAMTILLTVNALAIKTFWNKAKSNSSFYQEIIQDIGGELK